MASSSRSIHALLISLILLPGAVQATVRSQAALNDFTIDLVDLNPNDGLTPSIRFVGEGERPVSAFVTGSVSIRSTPDGRDIYADYFNNAGATAPFSDASGTATYGGTSAYASLTAGDKTLGPHQFLASGSAAASGPGIEAQYFATTNAPSYLAQLFDVSPYTLAVFKGHSEVFATVDATSTDAEASAYVELFANGIGALGAPGTSQISRDRSAIDAATGQFRSITQAVSVSFRNDSTQWLSGQVRATVYATGREAMAPVPEPGSVALALGGLTVLVLRARRSRR